MNDNEAYWYYWSFHTTQELAHELDAAIASQGISSQKFFVQAITKYLAELKTREDQNEQSN